MNEESKFSRLVGAKASRIIKARHNSSQEVWFGLGMTGLIGWSVVTPTLLGVAFGIWLDSRYPGTHSWTLALLVAGLCVGCFTAWQWVDQQDQAMNQKEKTDDE
ncbi:AtpZ/AtpI family protein [soil metagenome]